jgi:hypothetical protein
MRRKQAEMDEFSKAKLEEADRIRKQKEEANKEKLKDVVDPKTQGKNFYNRLS